MNTPARPGAAITQFPFTAKTRTKAAEEYSKIGWHIFPVHSVREGICTCSRGAECPDPGKHPIISPRSINNWDDQEQIKGWWKKFPYANIGLWLDGSNCGVLDLDKKPDVDGEKNLRELLTSKDLQWPDTLTCTTGSGGRHLYFAYDPEKPIPNKANALGPGIDCWSGPHYLILPPSDHRSGNQYKWDNWGMNPGPFPYSLLPEKRGPGRPRGPQKEVFDPRDRWQLAKLKRALDILKASAADREIWVKVGMIMGRAFNLSEEGFELYNAWAKGTDRNNYDEKGTRRNYYEWSKKPPGEYTEQITTASIYHWAKQQGELEEEPPDERPYQFFENPQHSYEEQDQLSVIFQNCERVFRRDSMLIEIVEVGSDHIDGEDDAIWRPIGYPITRQLGVPSAIDLVSKNTQWFKKFHGKFIKDRPDRAIVADFVSGYSDRWSTLRPFRMFTSFQTIRDDGSLITEPGYDRKSGLYLMGPPEGVKIPAKIGKKQIADALATLFLPFKHYRFDDEAQSKSGVLAAIFTVGLRHLFPNVPMFAFTAAKAAAGKTKAVQAISNMWFGKNPANVRYTAEEEELSKILGSCAISGDRMVLFDNVREGLPVRDPVLAGVLTSPEYDFRILGTNNRVKMSPVATFFMTGIKLEFSEEIQRRVLQIKILPHKIPDGVPTPEAIARLKRADLISAALTIIRGFYQAKCPKTNQTALASFEEWGMIRDLITWLDEGIPDPAGSISEDITENEEVIAKKEVVLGLHKMGLLTKITSADELSTALRTSLDSKNWSLLTRNIIVSLSELLSSAQVIDVLSFRTLGRILKRVSGIPFAYREGRVLILRRIGRGWIIEEREE